MKFIKIKDELLEKINSGAVVTVVIINDQDDLGIDEEIEFFNDENVAFGKSLIKEFTIKKYGDIKSDEVLVSEFVDDYDKNVSDHDLAKIVNFVYDKYDEPKSLSSNNDLETESLKIFADGGSRGNPGPSASGYVLLTEDDELIKANGVYLGITTNNQAEYKSIKFALEDALELGAKNIDVYMDSLLVVNQLNGKFKIRNEALYPIYRGIKELVTRFEDVTFTHVPRALNKLADEQVNICLDNELNK